MTTLTRSAGLLLHPSSLPGRFGIGDLGPAAFAWIDVLAEAGITWWQILPLSPTGYADSPYQATSAFAGNPNLISPERLVELDLLTSSELTTPGDFPPDRIDYDSGAVVGLKRALLERAFCVFQGHPQHPLHPDFEAFVAAEAGWLEDFALFMALKEAHELRAWMDWPEGLRLRQPAALQAARQELAERIAQHRFEQFLFARQWGELLTYAHTNGVQLLGDMPIFVSADSADVWANPAYFLLDPARRPTVVAGVPPDYFALSGQLWGNPLYDWDTIAADNFAWWRARLAHTLRTVDLVRIDHFRGFVAAWHVPAGETSAAFGHWEPGPGAALFEALGGADLPIIAEDLGMITPDIDALRTRFGFPGMRILQFAFGGAVEARFLPHNFEPNTVAYTGTHDNDTTLGWWTTIQPAEQEALRRYLGREVGAPNWELIRLAWASVAKLAIAPVQDVLGLGSSARMNMPGQAAGWWRWRLRPGEFNRKQIAQLAELNAVYER
jgi:4-alpha-glucanotransferase